jgi:hypothetical protein
MVIGEKREMLTLIEQIKINNRSYVVCDCECGEKTTLRSDMFGITKSCGCLSKKTQFQKIHGKTGHRLHNIWLSMKERCYNVNNHGYKNYGDRGIVICDEWLDDFMSFYDWANDNGYNNKLTIDRIDNDKGYSPDNCRWATPLIQQNNTRQTHKVEINGVIKSISEWSRVSGVKRDTILSRIKKGLTGDSLIAKTYSEAKYKSGIPYIKWDKAKGSWRTECKDDNGKLHFIGHIKVLEDAIQVKQDYINKLNKSNGLNE